MKPDLLVETMLLHNLQTLLKLVRQGCNVDESLAPPFQVLVDGESTVSWLHCFQAVQEGQVLFGVLLRLLCHHHDEIEVVGAQGNVVKHIDIDHVEEELEGLIGFGLEAGIWGRLINMVSFKSVLCLFIFLHNVFCFILIYFIFVNICMFIFVAIRKHATRDNEIDSKNQAPCWLRKQ